MAVKTNTVSWTYATFNPSVAYGPGGTRWVCVRWPDIAGDGWCAVFVGDALKAAAEANGISEAYDLTVSETTGIPSTDVSGAAPSRIWSCIYHGRADALGAVEIAVRKQINRYVTAAAASSSAPRSVTGWWSAGLFDAES